MKYNLTLNTNIKILPGVWQMLLRFSQKLTMPQGNPLSLLERPGVPHHRVEKTAFSYTQASFLLLP